MRDGLIRWIPRLQAEETLVTANAVALGVGAMGDRDRAKSLKETLRGLRRAMGQDDRVRPATWDDQFRNLSMAGFNVKVDGRPLADTEAADD